MFECWFRSLCHWCQHTVLATEGFSTIDLTFEIHVHMLIKCLCFFYNIAFAEKLGWFCNLFCKLPVYKRNTII